MTFKPSAGAGTITSVNGDSGPAVSLASTDLTDTAAILYTTDKGAANGVAGLDATGKVLISDLPIGKYLQIESIRTGTLSGLTPVSGVSATNVSYINFIAGTNGDANFDFRVPQDYVAGDAIQIALLHAHSTSSNTAQIEIDSELFRTGTADVLSTPGGSGTSSMSIVTSATALETTETVLDIAASGLVGGVAVSAGDLIKVNIERDAVTDSGAGDFYIINVEVRY